MSSAEEEVEVSSEGVAGGGAATTGLVVAVVAVVAAAATALVVGLMSPTPRFEQPLLPILPALLLPLSVSSPLLFDDVEEEELEEAARGRRG